MVKTWFKLPAEGLRGELRNPDSLLLLLLSFKPKLVTMVLEENRHIQGGSTKIMGKFQFQLLSSCLSNIQKYVQNIVNSYHFYAQQPSWKFIDNRMFNVHNK